MCKSFFRNSVNRRQEVIEKAAESAIVFFDELPLDSSVETISLPFVSEYLEKRRAIRGVGRRDCRLEEKGEYGISS